MSVSERVFEEPTISIPLRVVDSAIAHDSIEELEDWLLAHDPEFIARMTRARENDVAGRGAEWPDLQFPCLFD